MLQSEVKEDATDIQSNQAYVWHDWCLARGKDCLYMWCWAAALELSNGSNGWFRFILDGKLATMYSSGSPEGGNDNSGMFEVLCPIAVSVMLTSYYWNYNDVPGFWYFTCESFFFHLDWVCR